MTGPSIIMNYQITQEQQALCPHEGKLNYEMVFGKRTGDRICPHCGQTFAPGEEILPVAYRSQLIVTPHALLCAMYLNGDLELCRNPTPRARQFAWFLASKSSGKVMIGVSRESAEDCLKQGLISYREVG
ncbi:MAG: hypothetical protein JXB25_03270 [Deltaproteobacteria bacterium]|nr:hypothetical protein [Deltaproteobacteria bacterium]